MTIPPVVITRRVIPAGGGELRVLSLKSSYQPSRTVTLVGTGGKPAKPQPVPTPAPTRTP